MWYLRGPMGSLGTLGNKPGTLCVVTRWGGLLPAVARLPVPLEPAIAGTA